jgi:hypothetical protein
VNGQGIDEDDREGKAGEPDQPVPDPPTEGPKIIKALLPFWSAFAFGVLVNAWLWFGDWIVVLSASAAVLVGLLAAVAAIDLVLMARGNTTVIEWLPPARPSDFWDSIRSSLMGIAFFYGIIVGHFIWR